MYQITQLSFGGFHGYDLERHGDEYSSTPSSALTALRPDFRLETSTRHYGSMYIRRPRYAIDQDKSIRRVGANPVGKIAEEGMEMIVNRFL